MMKAKSDPPPGSFEGVFLVCTIATSDTREWWLLNSSITNLFLHSRHLKNSGFARGVDWLVFLQYVVPTIVCDMYEKQEQDNKRSEKRGDDKIEEITTALKYLSEACLLSLQYHITKPI